MNQTAIKEFFLLGFPGLHNIWTLAFIVLLMVNSATLAGNLLIIALVSMTSKLHSPMYLFLKQLSICDIVVSLSISPVMLHNIIYSGSIISFTGCLLQFYFFGMASVTECLFLTVMSYDRYLAICKPLHYSTTMNFSFCYHIVGWCWVLGITMSFIIVTMMSNQYFCGPNIIDHFFCDFAPLLKLSCSDTSFLEMVVFIVSTFVTVSETLFILATYVHIALAILKISTTTGRQKAFSTCISHIIVVCTYYGTLIAVYVSPYNSYSTGTKKMLSLLYTVVTPLCNPLIYSLRNKEIWTAIRTFFLTDNLLDHKFTFL